MSDPKKHPSQEDWLLWLERGEEVVGASVLEAHLRECDPCRASVALLRELRDAGRVITWSPPPDAIVERAAALPAGGSVPPVGDLEPSSLEPAGVRGAGNVTEADARIITRVFHDGEVGVLVLPPGGDGRCHIRGTMWLRSLEGDIRVVLAHDEHAIAEVIVRSGQEFEIEEFVPSGWRLEFHLPNGRGLILDEKSRG